MDNTTTATKTPIHLWIVGALATLWNAFGCYDYFMTRTQGAAYIKTMMPTVDGDAVMAYINAFPIWVSIAWAIGVWAGLAGSILLLLRHRLAVPVLLVSLFGALFGIGYQLVRPSGIAQMDQGANGAMGYIIIAVALGLFIYARAIRIKGLLS